MSVLPVSSSLRENMALHTLPINSLYSKLFFIVFLGVCDLFNPSSTHELHQNEKVVEDARILVYVISNLCCTSWNKKA